MSAPRRLLLVNGPNLNLLGTREPDVYGSGTLADLRTVLQEDAGETTVDLRQTDAEGELLGWLHEAADSGAPVASGSRRLRLESKDLLLPLRHEEFVCKPRATAYRSTRP